MVHTGINPKTPNKPMFPLHACHSKYLVGIKRIQKCNSKIFHNPWYAAVLCAIWRKATHADNKCMTRVFILFKAGGYDCAEMRNRPNSLASPLNTTELTNKNGCWNEFIQWETLKGSAKFALGPPIPIINSLQNCSCNQTGHKNACVQGLIISLSNML